MSRRSGWRYKLLAVVVVLALLVPVLTGCAEGPQGPPGEQGLVGPRKVSQGNMACKGHREHRATQDRRACQGSRARLARL